MYTKNQRHRIYKEALQKIESGENQYMCNALKSAISKTTDCYIGYGDYSKILKLKEFVSLIPEGETIGINAWWENLSDREAKLKRIQYLNKCIDMSSILLQKFNIFDRIKRKLLIFICN